MGFNEGFTKMEYNVNVIDGSRLTMIHLHCGSAGTNGAVAAIMWQQMGDAPDDYDDDDGSDDGENNPEVKGLLESKDLKDIECEGVQLNTIASLYQAIRNGSIYMNIHSEMYPGGVARGQIFL